MRQLFQQLNSSEQVDRDVYMRIRVGASRFTSNALRGKAEKSVVLSTS